MPNPRGRKKHGTHLPYQAKRAEEGRRYRQSLGWAKSLIMHSAGSLISMAVIVFGAATLGPKFTFGIYGLMMLMALAGAMLLILKAKRHNRRFQLFNGFMPVAARIAPPDRLGRRY